MGLKLHGLPQSTCTQRVLITLAEKGITDYELVFVNIMVGDHKQSPHLALHPFGKVPVLEDDGYFVYESRAICKYIEMKYPGHGTKLMPDIGDLHAYGLFEQACSVELNYFDFPTFGLLWEKVFRVLRGLGSTDEAKVSELTESLKTNLAVYETILSKQKYLAGDKITLADLFHLPHGVLALGVGLNDIIDKYPHVAKWFEALQARKSWKEVAASAST